MTAYELDVALVVSGAVAAGIVVPRLITRFLGPILTWLSGIADEVLAFVANILAHIFFFQERLHGGAVETVIRYLGDNAKKMSFGAEGVATRSLSTYYARSLRGRVQVWVRSLSSSDRAIFRWEKRLLWLTVSKDEYFVVRCFRWSGNLRGFLDKVARYATEKSLEKKPRGLVVVRFGSEGTEVEEKKTNNTEPRSLRLGLTQVDASTPLVTHDVIGWPFEDLGQPMDEGESKTALAFSPEMHRVFKMARFWYTSRQWYADRQLPWRWGCLLFGSPGTGKTSLVRALAEDLGLEVHVFNLAQMSNSMFQRSWDKSSSADARIVLVEDVDTVFHGRENITEGGMTFDTLLNAIDGVQRQSGLLLFVTTNDLSKVDPALGVPAPLAEGESGECRSTRPGRLDMTVSLPPLSDAARHKIALRITKDEEMATRIVDESRGDSAAQITDRATRAAIKSLWDKADAFEFDSNDPAAPLDVPPSSVVSEVELMRAVAESMRWSGRSGV